MTEEIGSIPDLKEKDGNNSCSIAKIFAIHDHNTSCDINYHVDLQRSYKSMLKSKDGDIFYSRTDLRMLIEKTKRTVYKELCNHYFYSNTLQHHNNDTNSGVQNKPSRDFVVHAAVKLSLKPENLQEIISEFPPHLFHTRDMFDFGVIPLHIAASGPPTPYTTVNNHAARVELILSAFPLGAKYLDLRGRLPLHNALLHRADDKVIIALIKANPNSLSLPFLPTESETNEKIRCMRGFLPFHMSCCLDFSCSAIFELIQNNPSCVCGYDTSVNILEE